MAQKLVENVPFLKYPIVYNCLKKKSIDIQLPNDAFSVFVFSVYHSTLTPVRLRMGG